MTSHPVTGNLPAKRLVGRRRVSQMLIGVMISGVLLWLTLRQINLADVRAALQQARLGYLVPAIATYFIDLGVRTWRWQALLQAVKPIGWRQLYSVMTIGYMGNMLLPARMGEVVRAAVLKRHGVTVSAALGSIATERVLDGLTTVAILLAASRFLMLPDWLVGGLITLTILFLGLLLVLAALLIGRSRVDAAMTTLSQRLPVLRKPRAWLAQFVEGAGALRSPRLLTRAVLIGLLAWTCSALQYFWVFQAFNLPLGAAAAFFAVSTVGLSTAIPAAPGYIGSFEFAGVAALGILGITPGVAFSAILTIHLLQIVPVTIAGIFLAWREGFSWTRHLRRPPTRETQEAVLMWLRRERLALVTITLLAAAIRFLYATLPRLVRWDEAGHLMIARNLVAGLGYTGRAGILDMHLPPVLPLLSAGLIKLGFTPEWATALIHVVTGALLCLPVYLLARAIYNGRVGLLAAALVAVYPALAAQPFLWGTMTESPFLLFVFTGVWAVYRALDMPQFKSEPRPVKMPSGIEPSGGLATHRLKPRFRSKWGSLSEQQRKSGSAGWYAAVGLCFGLAYLTRPEGLTYFAVLGLFMVLWHLTHRSFWRLATFARLALAVVVCLAVISPYVLFLHDVSGQWTLSGKVGLILDIAPAYIAHDQVAHDVAVSRLDSTGQEVMWFSLERFQHKLSTYVLENPIRFFYYMRRNMAETWDALFHQTLFSPWVVALAAVGLFVRPWDRRRWWHEGLLWAALLPLASFWLFFVIDRFLIGALPIGLIWAAAGLAHMAGWAAHTLHAWRPRLTGWPKTTVAALPVVLALAFSLWLGLEQLQDGLARMSWSHKAAGYWLQTASAPEDIIMTRSAEVGLYADRGSVTSPNATWAELLAYARSHKARYLVVDEYEVTKIRPQFSFLLRPEDAPPEVAHLRTFTDGVMTLVYRFDK